MKQNQAFRFDLNTIARKAHETSKNRIIRRSNKNLTEIPQIENNEVVQQLFLSNNKINTLAGLELFVNLRVLFLTDNKISYISELKYLKNLPVETFNMKGNPITKLPYYQQHVVSTLSQLKFFDDHEVNDQLRAAATSTVEFDECRLTLLCINEMRIQELEELEMMKNKDKDWLIRVQRSLGERSLESFGLDSESKDQNFDKMRALALEIRSKNEEGSRSKWGQIYDKIESIQITAIDSLSKKLTVYIDEMKNKVFKTNESKGSSGKNSQKSAKQKNSTAKYTKSPGTPTDEKSPSNRTSSISPKGTPSYFQRLISPTENVNSSFSPKNNNNNRLTPPIQSKITNDKSSETTQETSCSDETGSTFSTPSISNINDGSVINEESQCSNTLSPRPNISPPQLHSMSHELDFYQIVTKLDVKKKLSQCFNKWKTESKKINSTDNISIIFMKNKAKKMKRIYFNKWQRKLLRSNNRNKLVLASKVSHDVPYRNIRPSQRNEELYEQTQRMILEISRLKSKISETEKSSSNLKSSLEESVKNDEKMKNIIKRLEQEKDELSKCIKQSDSKYESDLVQFWLDTKVESDQIEQSIQKLQKESKQKELELQALNGYLNQLNMAQEKEIGSLQRKVSNKPFSISPGYRTE